MPQPCASDPAVSYRPSLQMLPWICSAVTHLALLLLLYALYPIVPGASSSQRLTTGITVTAVSADIPGIDGGQAGGGDGKEASAGEPRFFDEAPPDPMPPQPLLAATAQPPDLSAMIAAQPPVSLQGVLPRIDPNAAVGASAVLDDRTRCGGSGGGSRSGGRGAGSGRYSPGGKARTGVFGLVGEGYKFVYVFDRSGSMDGHGGAPLRAAKEQLIESIARLGDTHQFQIVFYNERPRIFTPLGREGKLVFATDQNKNQALRFIGSITADGATEHEAALALALRMAPDVVFFLTDADEPRLNSEQLARIRRMNRGSSICTVEFGFGVQMESDNFLVRLAEQNGGKHVYVDISKLVGSAPLGEPVGQLD